VPEETHVVPQYVVGLDWASDHHDVCVLDAATGRRVAECRVAHTAAGLAELRQRLAKLGAAAAVRVALERPSGLVVDALLEAGHVVVPIHPNALKASRPRYTSSGAKSDALDAYILADLLRTDGHRFRALVAPSDATRALRAAVRTRDDLVATRVQLANQLRSLLEGFWAGAAAIFADVDSPIALAFLAQYPSPEAAVHLQGRVGEQRLARFLTRQHYCGRRSAAELLGRLRGAPAGHAGPLEAEAKGQLVRMLVGVLGPLVAQLKDLDALVAAHLAAHLAAHPDGTLVQSFPRSGTVNAAQILAELGDDRQRFASADQLAAEAGVAPVTRASGKHRDVTCRFACNKRLRLALSTWADNSRHAHAWAAAHYRRARARGCDHPHAIRVLARAWTRVLWRCWRDHSAYDPSRHRTAEPLLTAA
jgi:transposase